MEETQTKITPLVAGVMAIYTTWESIPGLFSLPNQQWKWAKNR